MRALGSTATWTTLSLLLAGCNQDTPQERALEDYWAAYAEVLIAFDRFKRTDPARAGQLRAICSIRYGPQDYSDLMECIARRWTPPGQSGGGQGTRAEAEYVKAASDLSHALTPLVRTDPDKARRLRATCEADRGPDNMANCIAERWNG